MVLNFFSTARKNFIGWNSFFLSYVIIATPLPRLLDYSRYIWDVLSFEVFKTVDYDV